MIDNDKYCPWHVHTIYSILDGCNKIKDLVSKAKEAGFYGVSITDHGSMSGVVEMFQACEKAKIKPLIGCEIYLNDNRDELIAQKGQKKETKKEEALDHHAHHLVLIAKNQEGYKNLLKIQGNANENFYRFPLSTNSLVLESASGLMCSSACLGSDFNRLIKKQEMKAAEDLILRYKEAFKEDFFLELQVNGEHDQINANIALTDFSKKHDIPLILGNDCHYLEKGDHFLQLLKICTKTQFTLEEMELEIAEGRFMKHFESLYLLKPDDIYELKNTHHHEISDRDLQEALENTYNGAVRADVNLIDGTFKFPEPQQTSGLSDKDHFIDLCKKGFKERLIANEIPYDRRIEYWDRLLYEIEVITFRNFQNYFLVLKEALQFVRDTGGRNGAGRGCLTANTKVITSEGQAKNISDFQVGEYVYDKNGDTKEVIDVLKYEMEEDKLLKITTYCGDYEGISLTKDHKVFAQKGETVEEIEAQDLKPGDWIKLPKLKLESEELKPIDLSEYPGGVGVIEPDAEFHYLVGKWIADGYLEEDSSKFGLCFHAKEEGLKEVELYLSSLGFDVNTIHEGDLVKLEVEDEAFFSFWRDLFKDYDFSPCTKYIPISILKGIHPQAVFVGLMKENRIKRVYRGISLTRRLADEIRFLSLRLNLPSTLLLEGPNFVVQVSDKGEGHYRVFDDHFLLEIQSIEEIEKVEYVYDLTVRDTHSYLTTSGAVHNSAAGSLVCYCLKITNLDPIRFDLYFERFLSYARGKEPTLKLEY